MHTSRADVATVLLDAKTYRVYKAVVDSLSTDTKAKITSIKNDERLVEFTHGTATISLKVDSLANGLSQITVSAAHSDDSPKQPTDMAVEAILRVCQKIGIKCSVE
jgi:hypothetical protein